MEERLQKVLSRAGVASRRAAETLIAEGRVQVNGHTIRELGSKADPDSDEIKVDGRRVKFGARRRYILLYKPRGYITTRSDPQQRRTVMDLVKGLPDYLYPVGRLDYETEGLLILTNDGDLAAALTHPRHGVERTYEARVAGTPDEAALDRLRRGIPLDGHRTQPARAELINPSRRDNNAVVQLTITEGRNRQVRRMLEAIGHPVDRLARTRIGPIADPALKPGYWRELTPREVASLKRHASRTMQPAGEGPPRAARTRRPAGTPGPKYRKQGPAGGRPAAATRPARTGPARTSTARPAGPARTRTARPVDSPRSAPTRRRPR